MNTVRLIYPISCQRAFLGLFLIAKAFLPSVRHSDKHQGYIVSLRPQSCKIGFFTYIFLGENESSKTLVHWTEITKAVRMHSTWRIKRRCEHYLPSSLINLVLAGMELSLHSRGKQTHFIQLHVLCFIAKSCPALCDPMDYSPPGSFVHKDSLGKNTGVGCYTFLQGTFPTQGSNPGLPHCRQILYYLSHQGSPYNCIINNNFLNPMCQYVGKVNLSLRPSKRFLS